MGFVHRLLFWKYKTEHPFSETENGEAPFDLGPLGRLVPIFWAQNNSRVVAQGFSSCPIIAEITEFTFTTVRVVFVVDKITSGLVFHSTSVILCQVLIVQIPHYTYLSAGRSTMHWQRSDMPSALWAIISLLAVTNYAYCTTECTHIILMLPQFQPSVSSFVSSAFVILNHRLLWCTDHFRPIFLIKRISARYALGCLTFPFNFHSTSLYVLILFVLSFSRYWHILRPSLYPIL